jgi:hypothetical protein
MSVADHVGLRGETSELLALPDQRWDHGTAARPALSNCCGVRELRSWLHGSNQPDIGRLVTLEHVDVIHRAGTFQPGVCHHGKTGIARQAQEER